MQVGLESPLDLQVQQETMSGPRQRLQMQVGLESPLDLQVQKEMMSSVEPQQNLSTQAKEVGPQHELQVQPGGASNTHASPSPQQELHMQIGVMTQSKSGISNLEEATSSRPQPTLQFEELVHHPGSTDKNPTQNPQSQLYAYVAVTPEVVTTKVPTRDEIV